jgi:ABC transporter ATM
LLKWYQTSALDTNTEQSLLQNIHSILKEHSRTSIFVAHRLRTIYDSDQIIVLKDGHVAESGTHSVLMGLGGVYAQLWNGKKIKCLLKSEIVTEIAIAQETLVENDVDKDSTMQTEVRSQGHVSS